MKTVLVLATSRKNADDHINQHHAGEGLIFDKIYHTNSLGPLGKGYRYKTIEVTPKKAAHGTFSKLS